MSFESGRCRVQDTIRRSWQALQASEAVSAVSGRTLGQAVDWLDCRQTNIWRKSEVFRDLSRLLDAQGDDGIDAKHLSSRQVAGEHADDRQSCRDTAVCPRVARGHLKKECGHDARQPPCPCKSNHE